MTKKIALELIIYYVSVFGVPIKDAVITHNQVPGLIEEWTYKGLIDFILI